MYALILTIIVSYNAAPAMSSVSGFKSLEACQAAAAVWAKQVASSGHSTDHYALCARQD